MKHVSVVQHTQSEWLGLIEDHLEGRGIRFGYHRPFMAGGTLPDIRVIGDGLMLIGGGPWGAATGDRQLPTLEAEVRLARACLMLERPVVGIGLGAQILSLAGDGGVEASPLAFEVGEMRRVADGALAGLLPERMPNVVYMRDRPLPPAYAVVLAVDAAGRPALFQIGRNAFGLTGHPGLKRAMIEDLIMEFDEAPADPAGGLDRLAALAPTIEDALVPLMTGIVRLTGWMDEPAQ
jgi:GMP synthase-like glutamine amidotransferase